MEPYSFLCLSSAFPEFERQRIHAFLICLMRTSQKGDGLCGLGKGVGHTDSWRAGDPSLGLNCQQCGADWRVVTGQIEEVPLG